MQTTSLRGPSARTLRSSGVGKQSAAVKPYFGARNVVVRQAPPFQPDGVATPDTPAQKPAKDVPSVAAFGEAVRSMVGGGAAATQTWKCSISSSAPLKQEVPGSEGVFDNTGADLEVIIVDLATELRSAAIPVDIWHPPAVISVPEAGPSGATGWSREGPVTLPASVKSPGAVLVRKKAGPGGVAVKDYISSIKLVSSTSVFTIPAESWVSSAQGWRVFFAGNAYLPQHTPTALVDDRERELELLKGNQETVGQTRKDADRIYWYQTYNDLGNATDFRPALGGTKALPYPRRLATNRGDDSRGSEFPPPKGEKPWLPYDEQFSFYKSSDFNGDTLASALPAALTFIAEAGDVRKLSFLNFLPTVVRGVVRGFVRRLLGREPPAANFEDFADVLAMFKGGADGALQPNHLYPLNVPKGISHTIKPGGAFKAEDGTWDFHLDQDTADQLNDDVKASRSWKKGKGSFDVNDLFTFPVPKVLGDRPDAWYTDAEYGRQALAGQNPCALAALTVMPESMGSSIREEHVAGELQGATLAQLVAEAAAGGKPRLFVQDYWDLSAFWEEEAANGGKPKGSKDMVQHASRAIFYLQKDEATGADIALIPVAIELAHPDTHKENPGLPRSAGLVYARNVLTKDPATLAVWRLAKAVHKSLDSAFHQLVSHWLRTHAVLEPFHIAMRRNMSALHPVSKLMLPHFRYTLNINCNARSSLINAGGIIEKNFSAGAYALRLSSVVYGKYWTFAGQALPQDLADRGMVDPATGRPWTDYPYADDGLQLWGALTSYFRAYLGAYYTAGDKDVLADSELQAWWTEVKEHGHPDLVALGLRTEAEVWGFAGPIPSVERLVHVLATIAWLASGHHAAVNFGQYDFSSLILNASSLVRKPMPAPGSKAYKELVEAPLGGKQEGKFMEYLADPFSAVQVLATVKLLSAHAHDEHTLNEANMYLVDEAARKANAGFMSAMAALEADIEARNADPARWTRYGLQPGTAGPLPYTLLMPSSGAGVTMRGVPYSVSI